MCTVSMIGDFYGEKWGTQYPQWINPGIGPSLQPIVPTIQEFNDLKKEVLDLKELLKRAKEYDAKNGEPNCEMEEKVKLLKRVAELVGVELNL